MATQARNVRPGDRIVTADDSVEILDTDYVAPRVYQVVLGDDEVTIKAEHGWQRSYPPATAVVTTDVPPPRIVVDFDGTVWTVHVTAEPNDGTRVLLNSAQLIEDPAFD